MSEELRRILKMVEDGVITAAAAETLIAAMNLDAEPKGEYFNEVKRAPEPKKIRIYITEEGVVRVNMSIPFSLLRMGLKIGAAASAIGFNNARNVDEAALLEILKSIDVDELMSALADDNVVLPYTIVDLEDDGRHVQIVLE